MSGLISGSDDSQLLASMCWNHRHCFGARGKLRRQIILDLIWWISWCKHCCLFFIHFWTLLSSISWKDNSVWSFICSVFLVCWCTVKIGGIFIKGERCFIKHIFMACFLIFISLNSWLFVPLKGSCKRLWKANVDLHQIHD